MNETLVDYLAEKCNLYVSDLRRPENLTKILAVVTELPPAAFSVEDWNESLCYLFEKPFTFKTPIIAKKYYTDKLTELIGRDSK
jgi:hypothetical protein